MHDHQLKTKTLSSGVSKADITMPEGKEKVQLLQDDDSHELSVKAPGEAAVPISRALVCACPALSRPDLNSHPPARLSQAMAMSDTA